MRDILNSSKGPLKSSKIIVFWFSLVTLFGPFNCSRKLCISELLRKQLVLVVTVICETGH